MAHSFFKDLFVNYRNYFISSKERARDKIDDFTDEVLKIEHNIISSHKKDVDIIVNRDYNV